MDRDMEFDSESERGTTSSNFIFSRPNIIPSPEKITNFGICSDNVFGVRSTQQSEISTFIFAKPAAIERLEHKVNKKKIVTKSVKTKKSHSVIQDIKKSSTFEELQKNSKKNDNVRLELSKSISCLDVPDSLLVKSVAKEYFEQFGETLKVTIRPKRKMITIYYASKEAANMAFQKAGLFMGQKFKIDWTTSEMLLKPKKKESIKGKIASILNLDDEVKEELEALQGLEYNLPDPQNLKALTIAAKAKVKKAKFVANKEIPKRPLSITKSSAMKKSVPIEKVLPKLEVTSGNQNIIKITSATIEELQNQVRQAATTSEEKYKILDARDRLMRLKKKKQQNLATASVTKGTCPDMCPEKERYLREYQRQLSSYEQLDDNDYKVNHVTAIKQYSRSSADQEEPMAHDLRPVKSLKMTMSYLLHEIVDLCEVDDTNLTEWYHFLWDRMRSIRKDITQQELCCIETVQLVEQCARFHILTCERLCAEETSVFDSKINSENLTKCLQSLKYMYYDLREHGILCENEPEFRAYIILLNLNNGTFISDLSTLPPSIQHSPEVKFALEVYSAIAMNNYSRFFKLVRKTTYLNGCILIRYFNQVRVKALSVMVKAYCRTSGTTEFPLYELIDILGFEDEDEVFDFCSRMGLKFNNESLYIKLNKENFHTPSGNLEQGRAYNLVLSKRLTANQSVGQCIAGGVLPDKTFENHKAHNSFDSQGYLLPSSINAQDQNLIDSYEFMDDDVQFINEQKDAKSINKFSSNMENKNQINSTAKTTNAEFAFKSRSEGILPTSKANEIVPTAISSDSNIVQKANDAKVFAPSSTSTTSIFSKPSTTFFPSIFTKPSAMPTNSPFNMTVNKSIFSGSTQTNLFSVKSTPNQAFTSIPNLKQDISDVDGTSSNERLSTKRPLDDSEGGVEKKSMLYQDLLRKKQEEVEQRLKAEQEKLKHLQKIHQLTEHEYQLLQNEVIEDMCSSIAQAELDRLRLIDALSEKIYDGILLEICEGILDEQLFIQDMLIEVERRLRDRLLTKYYRIWKQWAARRRAQRREALDNTPVWLQSESVEECAKKLYHPEQKVAIKFARENKRQSLLNDEEENKTKYTPIQFIINVGLKENAKSLDIESSQHAFWKTVISWPLLENRLTLWRHKKAVNKYLSPEDYTLEPIFIQHKPSPQESLTICIRHFEGLICENCLTGTDALLFIVGSDEDVRSIERRLTKSVLSREKLMPIPLVVLIFGRKEENETRKSSSIKVIPTIENLMESGYVSEYTILRESSTEEAVVLKTIQSAILWLAINRSPAVPLEMDYLKRVFDDCLTEELWLRIQGHLSHNPQFSKAINDPNFIISLHNEAVNHIMDIILDPESMTYTDFAPELKIYLGKRRSYPCTYEYFDNVWKHPEYRAELERVMSSFIFPLWKDSWPIYDIVQLHDAITNYCCQILSYENSLSITKNIMSDLFLIAGYDENSCPSFADVLVHIVSKKISDIGGNTRVVYNKNHIKHFQTLPWWFKSSILIDNANKYRQEENHIISNRDDSIIQVQEDIDFSMDFDFEYEIDELNETFRQQEEKQPLTDLCEETRYRVTEVKSVAEKLEKELEEQKLRNCSLEERLKEALKDDDLEMDS